MTTGTREDGTYRPLLDVVVQIDSASQKMTMLVDSGADWTTIPTDVASAMLNLSFDKIGDTDTEVTGVGDTKIPGRVTDGKLVYLGVIVPTRIIVCAIQRAVLGRDFFAAFNVRFYWNRNPPEFFVERADAPRKSLGTLPPVNPTIRPKKKRH